eukprot:619504-Pyramimonas_sp.AAC.1
MPPWRGMPDFGHTRPCGNPGPLIRDVGRALLPRSSPGSWGASGPEPRATPGRGDEGSRG